MAVIGVAGMVRLAGRGSGLAVGAGARLPGLAVGAGARLPGLAVGAGACLSVLAPPRRRAGWTPGFYNAHPATVPRPGELIGAEPMDAYLVPGVRLRARAWRLLYHSTGALDEPTVVSGTLLLPCGLRRLRPLPLIGYAIGTHGLADAAAPSRQLASGHDWEAGLLALVLARGFALIATDYQGLGTPGEHPFMVGRALGRNVLDGIRAARALSRAKGLGEGGVPPLDPEGPLAVMGYSEGGYAAAWAAQLQPSYAPELELCGVAAGGAAVDLESVCARLDGSLFSFFLTYGALGYAAAYPELDLEGHLTAGGRGAVAALRETTVIQALRHGPRFARAARFSDPNLLELPAWRARIEQNRLGQLAPAAPVLLHHARWDRLVPLAQAQRLVERWSALGADVTLRVTPGGFDHLSGGAAGAPVALDWLAARLGVLRGAPRPGGETPDRTPRGHAGA